jgi:hypothetical protein
MPCGTECSLATALSRYFPREFHETSNRRFTLDVPKDSKGISVELFHEQLPLPVPCYDLLPVDELTVGGHTSDFGYSHLP